MKREILFRGKRIDNKEWIEGNLAHDAKISFISTSYIDQFEQVFEESVGQFTGLTDKNGTKMFEGDIFVHTDERNGKWSALVEFCNGQFGYDSTRCKCIENPKDWEKEYDKTGTGWFISSSNWTKEANFYPFIGGYTKIDLSNFEVIGNIHDNPELLKTQP